MNEEQGDLANARTEIGCVQTHAFNQIETHRDEIEQDL